MLRLAMCVLSVSICMTGDLLAEPNFIVFIADDMAWDDVGAYGNPGVRTPNIDQLAAEGMRFDRAYLTCSSCSPSRCSILTGRYPHSTGAEELHLPLPADQTLLSTPLREKGYYTAAVGKWHLGNEVISQMDLVKQGGGPGGEAYWVEVLQNRPKDKPFFLWLAATDPHRSYQPGALDPPHSVNDVRVPPIFPDTTPVREDLALYYDEIGRFDEFVGKVRAELESQGILDETFLLVMTDNGRPFPRCKTTVLEDGVKTPFIVRYPTLVKPGQMSESLVSSIDLAPTIVELAGAEKPDSFQGKSFVPILKTPQYQTRLSTYSEHNWHDYQAFERSVVTERYRFVKNWVPQHPATPPADAVRSPTYDEMKRLHAEKSLGPAQELVFVAPRAERELYDVINDPHCLVNLLADVPLTEENRLLAAELEGMLDQWQQDTDDTFPGIENLRQDGFDRVTGEKLPAAGSARPAGRRYKPLNR